MNGEKLKNITTKPAGTWEREDDTYPEFIKSEDGSIVYVKYVKLSTGDLIVMEYEIDLDDPETMQSVQHFLDAHSHKHVTADQSIESASKEFTKSKTANHVKKTADEQDVSTHREAPYEKESPVRKRTNPNQLRREEVRRKRARKGLRIRIALASVICMILAGAIYFGIRAKHHPDAENKAKTVSVTGSDAEGQSEHEAIEDALENYVAGEKEATTEEATEAEEVVEEPEIHPHCVDSTEPSNLVGSTYISVYDEVLSDGQTYQTEETITFDTGSKYSALPGVITFRGNNYRNEPTYGSADLSAYDLETVWSVQTGALTSGDSTWTGSGWTGQPLIVQWPKELRQHMNMYDSAKQKEDLVEVIYACLDGYIYFLDLETGEATRDSMNVGYTFKGAGALDPRGYPIMYVGAGYNSNQGDARVFVINLLDCSVMYTFGNSDSFAPRSISFFDSSPLVDAETDTLIYPGENGVLYFVKLGTDYDEAAGTLTIDPKTVKWSYRTYRNGSQYWYGMEDSAVIYQGYLYIMDNGGDFMCLDINTLELIWVQDSLDDSNGTPVLSVEDGKVYLYASTSFHLGWRSSSTATVPIWKIDAETGEIVWQTDYECESIADLSGGVQSTAAVGRDGLDDYIYVTVSRTGGMNDGVLACLSKTDGKVAWEHVASYAWSSPVCVYNEDGSGSVIYCSSNGKMYLIDGLTGEQLDAEILSEGVIEASPAVYNSYAVVGTRACQIKCVELK